MGSGCSHGPSHLGQRWVVRARLHCIARLQDFREKQLACSFGSGGKNLGVERSRAHRRVSLLVLRFSDQMHEDLKQIDIKRECGMKRRASFPHTQHQVLIRLSLRAS